MVREYIGARYVPKFMGTYDPTQLYEALCVVDNGSGTSYITKVPTPAGTPLTNTTYWAIYGAASGAIINLQNQIDDIQDGSVSGSLQNQIDNIDDNELPSVNSQIQTLSNEVLSYKSNPWHNKDVVVYGDSLSTISTEYWQYMTEYDSTINVTNRAVGGTRIQDGVTLLTAATDLNNFDVIVLAYGTNSWANTSMREMLNSYKEAFSIIANKAPTKEVIVIAPPYAHNDAYANQGETNDLRWHIADYANNVCMIANMFGHKAYNLYQICGVNNFNYTTYMEDSGSGVYVHQNELLGRRMAKALLNDSYYSSTATTYAFISADGTSNTRGFMVIKYGNHIDIQQRGYMTVAELQALDLNHIAPAPVSSSFFRDTDGNMGFASLAIDGTITLIWNGTEGGNVQGLHFSGIIANYE